MAPLTNALAAYSTSLLAYRDVNASTNPRHIPRSVASSNTSSGVPNSDASSAVSQPPIARWSRSFTSAVKGNNGLFSKGICKNAPVYTSVYVPSSNVDSIAHAPVP